MRRDEKRNCVQRCTDESASGSCLSKPQLPRMGLCLRLCRSRSRSRSRCLRVCQHTRGPAGRWASAPGAPALKLPAALFRLPYSQLPGPQLLFHHRPSSTHSLPVVLSPQPLAADYNLVPQTSSSLSITTTTTTTTTATRTTGSLVAPEPSRPPAHVTFGSHAVAFETAAARRCCRQSPQAGRSQQGKKLLLPLDTSRPTDLVPLSTCRSPVDSRAASPSRSSKRSTAGKTSTSTPLSQKWRSR